MQSLGFLQKPRKVRWKRMARGIDDRRQVDRRPPLGIQRRRVNLAHRNRLSQQRPGDNVGDESGQMQRCGCDLEPMNGVACRNAG